MSKLNKSINKIVSRSKQSRETFPGYEEAVEAVVLKNIKEMIQQAEAYFYLYNKKFCHIKTRTLDEYIDQIAVRFSVTNAQRRVLIKGRRQTVSKILLAHFPHEKIKEIEVLDNNYQYAVTFVNANYNNKMKQKDLGVIKQKEKKVATSIRLEAGLKHDAQEYAKKHSMTLTTVIETALRKEIYESDRDDE